MFSSAADASRARRPTDWLMFILASVAAFALWFPAPGPGRVDRAAQELLKALPGLFGWFWEISYDLLVGWSLFLLASAIFSHQRLRLLRDQLLAVAMCVGGCSLLGGTVGAGWMGGLDAILSSSPPPVYPNVRVALATSIIVVTGPHLSRPLRRLGRWILLFGMIGGVALGVAFPVGVVAGLIAGLGAAALVHLLFGSPGGKLPLDTVAAALAELGIEAHDLSDAELQPRGVQVVRGASADGVSLVAKVYGRDALDGEFLSSLWSYVWYRDATSRVGSGRLQQVEHEAFITMLAERAGTPVLPVVSAGMVSGRDALLVIEGSGRSIDELSSGEVSDDLLKGVWRAVTCLHRVGVAHGQLDGRRIVVRPDGSAALIDFGGASLGASDEALGADLAQLLVTTTLLVGKDRAVAAAVDAVGAEKLADALPFLQPAALDHATRRIVHDQRWSLKDLRTMIADAADVEVPELEKIRRVTVGSIVMTLVLVLIAYFVLSAISGIGWQNLVDELRKADAAWLYAALCFSPVIQVGLAISTLGATSRPVRLGPVLMLQYAIQFIELAVPSTAARIAVNIRFFERVGVTTTGAVAIGLIDSVSGFIVQVTLILVITLSGLASLDLSPSGSDGAFEWRVVVLIGALLLIGVVVLLAIPRMRRFMQARVADGRLALQVLHTPSKVGLLFAGNLFTQLLFAFVLGLCVRAYGYQLNLAELVLTYTSVSLFAGLMPVPGGIGVAEAGFTFVLVALGIPKTAAFAIAISFRIVTYYLPPIWGALALRWLRRHQYV